MKAHRLLLSTTFVTLSLTLVAGQTKAASTQTSTTTSVQLKTSIAAPGSFVIGRSSAWFTQLGLTTAIEQQANGGSGIIIGVVDTGIAAYRTELGGRISAASSCAAVTFSCPNGTANDDNGHGTAVAGIAASNNIAGGASMLGVAPLATVVAEKVLSAAGSGSDADVANGITKATAAGAKVINLSLTFIPSTAVMTSINNAANAGTVVVFAGGNSGGTLLSGSNAVGATAQTLSHIVFVGSVSPTNVLSSFSASPGTGSVVAGSTNASYASLWLVAPGQSVVAPAVEIGPTTLASWTGTSMAAPMVSGAIALLDATWPVLVRNGTTTAVLFATATDLGAPGVDPVYGNGLMNLTRAFQPVGSLAVVGVNGQSIPVSQLTGTELVGGALGTLSNITVALSKYTSFDRFGRNYYVNLSPLLSVPGTVAASNIQVFGPAVSGGFVALANGVGVSFMRADGQNTPGAVSLTDAVNVAGLPVPQTGAWLASVDDGHGMTISTGRGFSVAPVYSDALWGADSAVGFFTQSVQTSADLMNLAAGGQLASLGTKVGEHTRVAFAWTETATPQASNGSATLSPHAMAVSAGVQTQLADGWTGSATIQDLREGSGLLGSVYNSGALGFGDSHHTLAVNLATSYELGRDTSLVADGTVARTNRVDNEAGLFSGTTALISRGYEVGVVERNVLDQGDAVGLLMAKPLRVVDGSVGLETTVVDGNGFATTRVTRIGLTPNGSETDLTLAYTRHFTDGVAVHLALGAQLDAGNVRGAEAGTAQLRLNVPI
jgi:Subtilase family